MTTLIKSVTFHFIPRRYIAALTEHQKKLYPQVEREITDEGYPLLNFSPSDRNVFQPKPKQLRRRSRFVYHSRETSMDEKQDWPSIWPTAKTFSPSAVPLPVRQSYESKPGAVPRGKYANTELLKIPNFLHLTPPAIKRHCQALKKFCTKWPEELEDDENVSKYFPVTYITSDYVHSSPTIRDVRARIVTLNININMLNLNEREAEKFKLLARHRYDQKTGMLTIIASACPSRVQNFDYADYLLTALYFESKRHEKWEDDKPVEVNCHVDLDEYRSKVEAMLNLK